MRGIYRVARPVCQALCGMLFWATLVYAQTASLLPNGEQQFVDGNGAPYANGTVCYYTPSTLTPKQTWSDPLQANPNTSPCITLDSNGRTIAYGAGQYRQILKDQLSNTIWDQLTYGLGLISTNVVPFANVAALRANLGAYASGYLQGYTTLGDGGQGSINYISTDTTSADNNCTIFVDAANHRWYRSQLNTSLAIEQCGGIADNSTANNTAMASAVSVLASSGGNIKFSAGSYKFTCALGDAVTINGLNPISIEGAGKQKTFIRPATNCTNFIFTFNPTNQSGYVRDIAFAGDQLAVSPLSGLTWGAIKCSKCGVTDFTNIQMFQVGTGLRFDYLEDSEVHDIYLQGCVTCITLGGSTNTSGAQNVCVDQLFNLVLDPVGGGSANGLVIDSGACEINIYKYLEAGASYQISGADTNNGVIIQNTASGGHRPEGIRFFSANIDSNQGANVLVTSGWQIEFHGSLSGAVVAGPGVLIEAPSTNIAAVDGFWWDGGWIRGASTDGLLVQAGCNVRISDSIVYDNTLAGVSAQPNACGLLEVVNNMMGTNLYANLTSAQQNALALASGALTTIATSGNTYNGLLYVQGNMMEGNSVTAISDSSTATAGKQILNNIGYNPTGATTVSIPVTGSPFTRTAGASPEYDCVSGGTVSSIFVSPATPATVTNTCVMLAPQQSAVFTFSSTPTITSLGQ